MAELSRPEQESLLKAFLPFYNMAHQTNFSAGHLASGPGISLVDCDLFLENGEHSLMIQHTRAVSSPKEDFQEPSEISAVADSLRRRMKQWGEYAYVFLDFQRLPTRKHREQLAAALYGLILHTRDFQGKSADVCALLEEVGEWAELGKFLRRLEIRPAEEALVGHFLTLHGAASRLSEVQMICNAVETKSGKVASATQRRAVGSLILLIDFEMYPFDVREIEQTSWKDQRHTCPFAEVWILNNFRTHRQALRLFSTRQPNIRSLT